MYVHHIYIYIYIYRGRIHVFSGTLTPRISSVLGSTWSLRISPDWFEPSCSAVQKHHDLSRPAPELEGWESGYHMSYHCCKASRGHNRIPYRLLYGAGILSITCSPNQVPRSELQVYLRRIILMLYGSRDHSVSTRFLMGA